MDAGVSSKVISVVDFGAVGNGVIDDTVMIQNAINFAESIGGGVVEIPDGTYLINPNYSLYLFSNITLSLAPNTILKAIPTSSGSYSIITIRNVKNVSVTGGTLEGDRFAHIGNKGGNYGRDINIEGAQNITISNLTVTDSWGDGIYLGNDDNKVNNNNVTIKNVICNNNRRNGISLIDGSNIVIENVLAENSKGAPPAAGIDIEPNNIHDELNHVRVANITTKNDAQGLQIGLTAMRQSTNPLNIFVINDHDVGSAIGLFISTSQKNGLITIVNSSWVNNKIQQVRQLNRSPFNDDTFLPIHTSVIFKQNIMSQPLIIQSSQLPTATVGKYYNVKLASTGGLAPYVWGLDESVNTHLSLIPDGLVISPTGYISGTPTTPGTKKIYILVNDNEHNITSKLLTLNIKK